MEMNHVAMRNTAISSTSLGEIILKPDTLIRVKSQNLSQLWSPIKVIQGGQVFFDSSSVIECPTGTVLDSAMNIPRYNYTLIADKNDICYGKSQG